MSTSHTTTGPAWRQGPPTKPQLSTLRNLAQSRGQSFAYPKTAGEASDEIDRLIGGRPSSRVDHARERGTAKAMPLALTNAASIRDDEVVGWGSTARWAGQVPDEFADEVCAPWDLQARRRRNQAANRESKYRRRAA